MGYVPPDLPPPRLNLDRFGLPRDYATYVWLLYGKRVGDKSPERRAFLQGSFSDHLGAVFKHTPLQPPEPDPDLIDTMIR